MPIRTTVEANITGAFSDIFESPPSTAVKWVLKTATIGVYILLHTIASSLGWIFENTIRSSFVDNVIVVSLRLLTIVPVVGSPLSHRLTGALSFVKFKIIPFLDNAMSVIEYSFYVKMINDTVLNDKVKMVVTGDPFTLNYVDDVPQTTLILSNHRSIIDYIVISKLILETKENIPDYKTLMHSICKNSATINPPPIRFISWGSVSSFPTLKLLFNIWAKDENCFTSTSKIHSNLSRHGNSPLVIFPEVNSITPELVMIQQKLLKNKYEDTPSLKQVLYPRYKQLNAAIKDLASWKKVKKRHGLMEHVVDKVDKWIHDDKGNEQDFVELESLLNTQEGAITANKPHFTERIMVNEYVYNLTIVYYQPVVKQNDPTHIFEHNHPTGVRDPHFQLEHITPSLWDMYKSAYGDRPIIIKVHVQRSRTDPLLHMKSRHLEKWLENSWCDKDKLITVMENSVKVE
ncbi:HDL497Cp [Eremothecium sinecaudum]|uniref:HDL497Cp n=1 Tax=Eremothecium sinecaudum TaxID=45286 RepID=A0A0X8HRS0_9SACH|nr:HDL497Cp [Eremothecium sinecaudum]AMD20247.1 HDL497Cp [Eremothecium sinecaudum]